MNQVSKKSYGYKITFRGFNDSRQLEMLDQKIDSILANQTKSSFGVLIDAVDAIPFSVNAEDVFESIQNKMKANGMLTSVVMYNSSLVEKQLEYIAKQNGIKKDEAFIKGNSSKATVKQAEEILLKEIDKKRLKLKLVT